MPTKAEFVNGGSFSRYSDKVLPPKDPIKPSFMNLSSTAPDQPITQTDDYAQRIQKTVATAQRKNEEGVPLYNGNGRADDVTSGQYDQSFQKWA